ncbi:amidohydrolase family protein [Aquihabitans sp. G128]|uniref:N-acyl-D-amino-acid deacylase family protein n=1 Tax=Aquihabitans sp. G128 TaxID=2849779 RepID=UPI001C22D631|nr:amidohydrolase family protein [Aquihabitans sp. G128]QXC60955.1 amidohydrolase family protein [Aquihabitans sp. G128]
MADAGAPQVDTDPAVDHDPPVLIVGGTVFDGSGERAGLRADVLVRDGIVAQIGLDLPVPDGATVVDATGKWVTPGFVDLHTHYDAEIEIAPALGESVRHGVTSVLVGSCGLSFAMGTPEDLADQFCRVEAVPYDTVLPLLEKVKDWETPAEYLDHLDSLPLGPNVTAMFGHSAVRVAVMGLGRSVDDDVKPTGAELDAMTDHLQGALDAGYLGMSFNTLPWDKLDGDRYRSKSTPSVYAKWKEYRHFAKVLRSRGKVMQMVPDLAGRWNIPLIGLISTGVRRRSLKMMVISMVDSVAMRGTHRMAGAMTSFLNDRLGAEMRWQSLPLPFELWVDGMEVPVMEELGAGTQALHETDLEARKALLADPAWREMFKKQWSNPLSPKAWHRDLDEPKIIDCPDPALVGRSFASVAKERGIEPLDCFLDLQQEFGNDLRWYTVVGNDRLKELEYVVTHPTVLIGFSDAGAHLRNMAYYDFPLHLLRLQVRAEAEGRDLMSPERAVHRLTGEIADYLGIDAGHLEVGRRADVVVVDPTTLDDRLDPISEDEMVGMPDLQRLVRRHDDCVPAVLVNGRLAWHDGAFAPGFGDRKGYGHVLRSLT